MPLINKKLLEETINKNRREIPVEQKIGLQNLFVETLNRIDSGRFKKEESEKVPFLQKMFELLGYEMHKSLEFEFSIQGRSIDGVLGEFVAATTESSNGNMVVSSTAQLPQVAIEWKGIDTKSLDKGKAGETPVSQMWDYMGKVGAEIGIVGNFLEWRLYTLQTKQSEYHEFRIRDLVENESKIEEMIFLLRKSSLLHLPTSLKGGARKQCLLLDLINQSDIQQEQITKRFYNDYKQRRLNLFEHLVKNNDAKNSPFSKGVAGDSQTGYLSKQTLPKNHKHFLLEKAQKILDRLIFIMFCEDGYLLPSGTVRKVFENARNSFGDETKIWQQFKGLFRAIDKGSEFPKINAFNGGLFAQDLELDNLVIKDEIWQDLIKLSEYDFESDLNVNILGHIFEQSIADIEEIKEEVEVEDALSLHGKQGPSPTKPKTSKRKKDGIYYTPEYITDYIVSETVGSWLVDKTAGLDILSQNSQNGETSSPLHSIKILDPAGGSGAFPNQVHSYLAKKQVEYIKKQAESNGLDSSLIDIDEKMIDKSILKNNIFMVDLQPESVEIAKLSLWLKTAKKDQKLNNLDDNLKVGNSLIDDPKIAGSLAFDWEKEFGWLRDKKSEKSNDKK